MSSTSSFCVHGIAGVSIEKPEAGSRLSLAEC